MQAQTISLGMEIIIIPGALGGRPRRLGKDSLFVGTPRHPWHPETPAGNCLKDDSHGM